MSPSSASDGELIAGSIDQPVRFAAIFDPNVDPVRRFVTPGDAWRTES